MSRHRNIRTLDADEEYDNYNSCYGHSFEEDIIVSPGTEARFLYNRATHNQGPFESPEVVPEEESEDEDFDGSHLAKKLSLLNAVENAKLQSCLEALQDIVGETIPEVVLQNAAIDSDFDLEKTLSAVLKDEAPKPPRSKRLDIATASDSLHSDTGIRKSEALKIPPKLKDIRNQERKADTKLPSKRQPEPKLAEKTKDFTSTSKRKEDTKILQAAERVDTDGTDKPNHTTSHEDTKTPKSKATRSDKNAKDLYDSERKDSKPLINLVVIGHVDAGKSTMMGHLLYTLGNVSQKNMHKFEKESQKLGKGSFKYAWVLDETPEERNRGITMDVAQSYFETQNRAVNLLDAPGHKDFIPNMITGASQADVAILVVDSTKGEFETGFEAGGQTREHTMLIRSLGVAEVVVAVNKMDNVGWDESRFGEIRAKLSSFLKQVGFKESDIKFIPLSGLSGENLTNKPKELHWFSGPTLVEAIDKLQPPERPVDKPFRMCVGDVFKGVTGGICIDGKIETGIIKTGDKILITPANEQTIVKGLSIDEKSVTYGFAGDHVIATLTNIDPSNIISGSMLCSVEDPIRVTTRFEACLVIFNISVPITKGYPVVLHYQSLSEQATIKKLVSQINRATGEVVKNKPRCIVKNSSANVEIEVQRPICIELSKDFKNLGRFMLRTGGSTIAAGLVTRIL